MTAIVWLSVVAIMGAQNTTVAIARKDNNCGLRTDIGYIIITDGNEVQQRKTAEATLFQKYPDLDAFEVLHSEKKHVAYQNIVVIISTTTSDTHCEIQKTYGAGFGYTQESALKNALAWISMLNPKWNKEKDNYQVELLKDFAQPASQQEFSVVNTE